MKELTGNEIAWLVGGVPALIAWIAVGLAWLLAPHLNIEPDYLTWALYGAGGWYGLMILIFGGWLGLFALAAWH